MGSSGEQSIPSGGRQADLDAAAEAYAARREEADTRARHRLRDDFVAYCLPFARRLARRYRGRGESLEDIEQVARLGLVKAIDRYDPARGSFTSYAVLTVLGEIRRHFRDATWSVHVVRRLQNLGIEVRQAAVSLTAVLARAPTPEELAAHLDVEVSEVRDALDSASCYWPTSLNTPFLPGTKVELVDLLGGTDPELEAVDDRLAVAGLVRLLPDREQRMLALRYFGNLSQAEIAAELGVSQMQVSRLQAAALSWLREAMMHDRPPPWRSPVRRRGLTKA